MTERLMVAVLKTAVSLCGTVGSNPTPSGFSLFAMPEWNPCLCLMKRVSKYENV